MVVLYVEIIVGAVVATIAAATGTHWLTMYVLPSKSHAAFAKIVNVPRRHLESLDAWQRRTLAASDQLCKANDAFLKEAAQHGSVVDQGRLSTWSLPRHHPAAVALLRARYPDGPSIAELTAMIRP